MIGISKRRFLSLLAITLLFSGCQKEPVIIDYQLVITKTDRSINTDADVVIFDVINASSYVAAAETDNGRVEIYTTSDGGKNWELRTSPINFSNDLRIQGIAFLDTLNGVVIVDNKAYRTYDGALSWIQLNSIVPTSGSDDANYFFGVSKSDHNEFLLYENNANSWYDNKVLLSAASSGTYDLLFSFDHSGEEYDYGHYSNGKFYYLSRDFNFFFDQNVYVLDLYTLDRDTLHINYFQEIPRDAVFSNGRHYLACATGKVYAFGSSYNSDNYYNYHDLAYNGIETMGDYEIAVAEKSISTNYTGTWEEALNLDGSGQFEYFNHVQRLNDHEFLISGKNGLFFKGTFE